MNADAIAEAIHLGQRAADDDLTHAAQAQLRLADDAATAATEGIVQEIGACAGAVHQPHIAGDHGRRADAAPTDAAGTDEPAGAAVVGIGGEVGADAEAVGQRGVAGEQVGSRGGRRAEPAGADAAFARDPAAATVEWVGGNIDAEAATVDERATADRLDPDAGAGVIEYLSLGADDATRILGVLGG
jgi:hypothetical protein